MWYQSKKLYLLNDEVEDSITKLDELVAKMVRKAKIILSLDDQLEDKGRTGDSFKLALDCLKSELSAEDLV